MRKDILGVMEVFREKGYVCGYLTTNGTIISEERAEALADLAASRLPEAHQRLDRRARRDARQGARRERHVRADLRGAHAPAGRGPPEARAAARQHQHDGRARDARRARPDGRRRRRARRRRDRPQSPDVQHAGGSGRDGAADRRRGRVGDLDVRHGGSRPRLDARPRARSTALAAKCRRTNIRFDMRPKVHPQLIDNYYTPGATLDGRCLYPFLYARVSFSGKVYFCPFIRVEVGDLHDAVARGGLDRRAVRRAAQAARRRRTLSRLPPLLQGRAVADPVAEPFGADRGRSGTAADPVDRGSMISSDARTRARCSSIRRSSAASPSRARAAARSARRCSARPSRRTRSRSPPRCSASAGCDVRLVDLTAARPSIDDLIARLDAEGFRRR